MDLGSSFEVQTSSISPSLSSESRLCETVPSTGHGDSVTTTRVQTMLGTTKNFVRMDGLTKLCVVGSGGAEGNLRLPPEGYREKIWDHAAGVHFVLEAGGQVTDLLGRPLDFREGRFLSRDVVGVVASNGLLHDTLVVAVNKARREQGIE